VCSLPEYTIKLRYVCSGTTDGGSDNTTLLAGLQDGKQQELEVDLEHPALTVMFPGVEFPLDDADEQLAVLELQARWFCDPLTGEWVTSMIVWVRDFVHDSHNAVGWRLTKGYRGGWIEGFRVAAGRDEHGKLMRSVCLELISVARSTDKFWAEKFSLPSVGPYEKITAPAHRFMFSMQGHT
jgi:hypothetical protein